MSYQQASCRLLRKQQLTPQGYSFTLYCPGIAAAAQPGQFAHLKVDGFQLRRPISICEIDRKAGTIRLVFEIRGEGTDALSQVEEGASIDVIAPLGHGFTLCPPSEHVILIGGGIGTPPMLELAKHYGRNATVILGFRDAAAVLLMEDFIHTGAELILCTDNGSAGRKGIVTEALAELRDTAPAMLYACGPAGMLKGVAALADTWGIPCEISLEERMGCGVGACLGCACKAVKNGKEYYAHVCKDGPVFNSKEVLF